MLIPPKFPEYPAVEDALWTSLRSAIMGKISVEAGLELATEQIRKILGNPFGQ